MKSVDTGDTQNSAKGSGDIKSRKEMLPPDFQTKSESGESKEKKDELCHLLICPNDTKTHRVIAFS